MNISVFDMYRIGIGPSSSHTVGPMRAGRNFISLLRSKHLFPEVEGIKVRLMGSLAATGIGHATDSAVLLGLMGKSPSVIDVDSIPDWIKDIKDKNRLLLDSCKPISFTYSKDLTFEPSVLDPYHTNTLIISYHAISDRDTICNLTNHSYFNLDGHQSGTLEHHRMKIIADSYIPIDHTSIPLGEIASVAETPFDFRSYQPISAAFQADCVQVQNAAGLDHSFVVSADTPIQAAVYSTESGILLTCKTTQPAIHVYTANFVAVPTELGKDNCAYGKRSAFCLETQNFPDAINHSNFPSPILRANTPYQQETQFHFSLRGEA